MSIIIGIAIACQQSQRMNAEKYLQSASRYFGYCLDPKIENISQDIKGGLVEFINKFNANLFFYVRPFCSDESSDSYDIHQELFSLDGQRGGARFFGFCREIEYIYRKLKLDRAYLIFASEWERGDRVRVSHGDSQRLVTILSQPGHWTMNMLNVRSGIIEECSDYPFCYEIVRDENAHNPHMTPL